jgi:hypothetical protein
MKAFPSPHWKQNEYEGMDLRDYFAAKAMQLFLGEGSFNHPEAAAQTAYEYADAMMKAREQNAT